MDGGRALSAVALVLPRFTWRFLSASHDHAPRRGWRPVLAAALALAGCGSSPPANITLAAPAATSSTPEKVGDLATERIKWASNKPDCKGDCPRIEIDSVAFPGIPKLTALVDHVLAYMTGTDAQRRGPYETLSEYTQYFGRRASARCHLLGACATRSAASSPSSCTPSSS